MKTINNLRKLYKSKLKRLLGTETGCNVQHAGFPCGTCFFGIEKCRFNVRDWHMVLLMRGDYKANELAELPPPEKYESTIKSIIEKLER